ncbi:hypothetical protein JY651_27920 [Pyxidicoccus parkwayensis]|uniref:Uncharacterized protein n=1 Tax=Pyxidicoccus parkwayensis TaxID=2813578 RepID=A0ABX7NJX5_9BACT|nr:hypothetical protein [Pyxidicoccus parkwaysis]QSQ19172.1 hypothetical protein JY651_27920 [Pyxidicoccus parkwaysis]
MVRGRWFTHDVVGEVLQASMPEPIRASLRERIDRTHAHGTSSGHTPARPRLTSPAERGTG